MSAPAQKDRPRPATTTARVSVHRGQALERRVERIRHRAAERVAGLRSLEREPGHRALRGQAGGGSVGHERSRFATISRMISEVPEAMVHRRTSRKKRSTGNSLM